jgi:hypothetical protein
MASGIPSPKRMGGSKGSPESSEEAEVEKVNPVNMLVKFYNPISKMNLEAKRCTKNGNRGIDEERDKQQSETSPKTNRIEDKNLILLSL